ncbi:replicative DNA helicase [Mesoplasma entomophilum]|uniref:Replicative DNA helicase n=1 Tax=Mesoplasma entomophilum TaxID=2149 RepID=A0A3S5XZ12_9MOLU|nr:replicative DNA helicase [Mesoplasma entomophilum]ATQ35247.1 replicative DNA helicase [Mesoplasma entomophilum]ATZ19195.1 replicative DNA helicase [Mesoplasma entomophilum]
MSRKDMSENNLYTVEKMVLAIAMHSPNALPDIMTGLVADDFLDSTHKIVFQAITDLHTQSKEVTINSVANQIEKKGNLESIGGIQRLQDIALDFFSDEGIENFIEDIFYASSSRKFDAALRRVQNLRREEQMDIETSINEMQKELLKIDLNAQKNDVQSIHVSTESLIKKIQELEKRSETLTGIPTDLFELDEITSGLQEGDLIILAARPSMGKTAFALNLAYNAARHKNGVAVFSLEMPAEQLTQRIMTMVSKIDSRKLRTGKNISKAEWSNLLASKEIVSQLPIYIDDTPGITVQQIQSKLYKLKRDHDVKFCVVDYLQLISSTNSTADRQNEISNISRQLKRVARELRIPIVCLSQLSRSVEKREDKRPIMSDLRDSGAIEQDADIIMFLYRDDYYKHKDANEEENKIVDQVSSTDLILSKHRNGATGTISILFDKSHGKFMDKG